MSKLLFNPVEKNLFVSLYGIDVIKNLHLGKQFSNENIEIIIKESGANIDGRLSDKTFRDISSASPRSVDKFRSIAMLSESTAAVSIFPKDRYASFFLSTCGEPDPLKSIDPLINLFRPIKSEVRYFTSSPIGTSEGDEEVFWKRFDDQKIPHFYSMVSKSKEKNGIYFDLVSDLHDGYVPIIERDSPVEKNMQVSLYGVDLSKHPLLTKSRGLVVLEDIVESSGMSVIGRNTKEFDALDGSDIKGYSYVTLLDNGSAAYHVTPESNYVSFFISGGLGSVPFKSFKILMETFKPSRAEVRYFGSSEIDKIQSVDYNESKNFWDELNKHELPKGYVVDDKEKLVNELYFSSKLDS